MGINGFGQVPNTQALNILHSLLTNPLRGGGKVGTERLKILKPVLLSELLATQTLTQGIEPNTFFQEPIFHIGANVIRSSSFPIVEVIIGRGIDLSNIPSSLPFSYLPAGQSYFSSNPHDRYVQSFQDGAHPRLPEGITLRGLINIFYNKARSRSPITTFGPIGRLLALRTLFIEGLRVPSRGELINGGFTLHDFNRFYTEYIDPEEYNPYLLMILQRKPLTIDDHEGQLTRQTVRLIQEITSSRLTTHVTLRTVPLMGIPEQDRTTFLDALESSTESLKP